MELKIGEKIKRLRLASGLTQAELADRAQLTKGFISQLENDQTSISVDSLALILDGVGMTLAEFFSEQSQAKIVFSPAERVAVEERGPRKFEILVPGSTNNLMDPIWIELAPGERMERQEPHPGEQFGFVFRGTATLRVDRVTYKVPPRHCFYFESDRPSQVVNSSSSVVQLLWVSTPPQM